MSDTLNVTNNGGVSAGPTEEHHDWVQSTFGVDPRNFTAKPDTEASGDEGGGGLWGSITGAVSAAASSVANVAGDVAGGAISTVENVASDLGHTVADAASGVLNTVATVAADAGHTVADAAGGLVDTAGKVAGDIGSGDIGGALGDAASGVISTAGHVASDVAHTAVDAGSGMLSTAGKILTDTQEAVADAATGVISTAGKAAGDAAQAVAQAAGPDSMLGRAAGAAGSLATGAASGLVDTVNTVKDLDKGVVEGVVGGVEGLAKGVVSLGDSVGKEAFALATDEHARERALDTVADAATTVGNFEVEMVTDPGRAIDQVADAASGAASTAGKIASHVYQSYEEAAAAGHGAEFLGKGIGQGAVLVGGALIPGVGEAEAGVLATEGAVEAADLATTMTEGADLIGGEMATTEELATSQSLETIDGVADGTKGATSAVEDGGPVSGEAPPSEPPSSSVGSGGGGGEPPEDIEGLAFRKDLPEHLAGPDGWKAGRLNGTHNAQNAMSELEGRGAMKVDALQPDQPGYTVTNTQSPGIDRLDYQVVNPNTGKLVSGSKTTYDSALYTDEQMVEMSQEAGTDAFSRFKLNPSAKPPPFDTQVGNVTMRSYINFDPVANAPYVGNVHPIDPADALYLAGGP